jgi:hypothetical protein
MQPGMAGGFDAKGQQRIMCMITATAAEAAAGRRSRWISVQPFDDAAEKGAGFGLQSQQAAIKLGDPGALVEEDLPVLSRPAVPAGLQQRHDVGLVTRQQVEDYSWRRC